MWGGEHYYVHVVHAYLLLCSRETSSSKEFAEKPGFPHGEEGGGGVGTSTILSMRLYLLCSRGNSSKHLPSCCPNFYAKPFFFPLQILSMQESFFLISALLGRCPSCLYNFRKVFCEMTCGPGGCGRLGRCGRHACSLSFPPSGVGRGGGSLALSFHHACMVGAAPAIFFSLSPIRTAQRCGQVHHLLLYLSATPDGYSEAWAGSTPALKVFCSATARCLDTRCNTC